MKRLPLVLSLVALAVAIGAATSLGQAANDPRASADSADRASARRTLDLVWISDSVGLYVAPVYAYWIRRDLGVRVRVHDEWEGGLPATEVLARLRRPSHRWVRLIRNAEVIFVSGNARGLGTSRGGDCVTTFTRPIDTRPQVFAKYVATLKAIYRQIFAIRRGAPVILRTDNWYVPVIEQAPPAWTGAPQVSWRQAGVVEPCTRRWEQLAAAIGRAAAAYRVPVVDLYSALNGPSHPEDPVAKGYIQGDGIHINARGERCSRRHSRISGTGESDRRGEAAAPSEMTD